MADISQLRIGNVVYDIKDTTAREGGGSGGGSALDVDTSGYIIIDYDKIGGDSNE